MATTIDLTPFALIALTLIGALIARYVIPWLRGKMDEQQYEIFVSFVRTGVYAADQLFNTKQGKEKKQYVLDFLSENGFEIDAAAVEAHIEAMVKELKMQKAYDNYIDPVVVEEPGDAPEVPEIPEDEVKQ